MPADPTGAGAPTVRWYITAAIVIIVLVAGGFGLLISGLFPSESYELVLGLMIILGASVLTVLLFIMAAAFSSLNLSDSGQALGLPVGSVRAMIAFLLIIVWAIVSVSVFRFVAFGSGTGPGPATAASPDGIKLEQQLFTTMSTLVVAISAFYFGSSSVASAQRSLTSAAPSPPEIVRIIPNEGRQDQGEMQLTILGKNFLHVKSVRLVLTPDTIVARDIVVSTTAGISPIDCKITIDNTTKLGQWDVIVTNDDGKEYTHTRAFTIVVP